MFIPLAIATLTVTQADKPILIDTLLGSGIEAQKGDVVTVLYKGWMQNGKEFDTTKDKPPFAFPLGIGEVIKGWDLGVESMKVGGKRILSIPPALGYGDKGTGPIPPNATLIFDIELLRVDKKDSEQKIVIDVTSEGAGAGAKEGDAIEVHYRGTFLNGVKFDSSYDRNETFKVEVGKTRLIVGFTQGLLGLKVGGKRKVTIPYQLAYGEAGRPPVIPKYSTLIFELERVK